MDIRLVTPILNVTSLLDSFVWFGKLGWTKRWEYGEPPDFGAVGVGGCEIFLCEGCQGAPGTWMTWWLLTPAEVDAAHARALEHGLTVTLAPSDQPWNVRECHVRHPDGHVFRLSAALEHDELHVAGPGIAIERVDMPVRLERRLAALLSDLAEHKKMTVSECLEETLLHSFEVVGGGVASPHTTGTHAHIRTLRERHGIDYDSHAAYRFVERP
jgi:Glyoxalase/Bleomycin resistance protein/Dioxygenase superfamily